MNLHASSPIRTIFMGSPDFSLPTLRALAGAYHVVGVVTQPDRPSGRGQELHPPPVKILAQELGLPVIQPRRLKDPEALQQLYDWQPELIVVAAFGQILRAAVLDLPRHGCINVHASLLPRWRGAAPIQAAILAGDRETGVTIMKMDPGIDTGPMLSQRAIPIEESDTAGSLSDRLAELGAALLLETLPPYLRGDLLPRPQEDPALPPEASRATYAPMLKKEDGELDFTQPAEFLARKVRAYAPWPGTFTFFQGQVLKVHNAHKVTVPPGDWAAGQTLVVEGLPAYTCRAPGGETSCLVLDELQPAGKRPMPGKVFLQGARNWV